MDIVDKVGKEFPSRYTPYPFQRQIILDAGADSTSLEKMDVGTGKTIVSWFLALGSSIVGDTTQILILCPPTLIRKWHEFVKEFENIPSTCAYQGSPKERAKMNLTEAIIIMGYQIFLKDFDKVYTQMKARKVYVICDEVSLRDSGSKTFKNLRQLFYNVLTVKQLNALDTDDPVKPFTLLNATPVSNPGQAYGYIKTLTPFVYKTQEQFNHLHVAKFDQYKKPRVFKNMDLLETNFKLRRFDANADELLDIPPITYIPIKYDLDHRHLRLYQKMTSTAVAEFPAYAAKNGKEIDSLFTRLQQMVTNPEMFGAEFPPVYLELLDERLEELGPDEKVIIYGHFIDTNRRVLQHLGNTAVGLWSDFTQMQKNKSEDAFKADVNRMVAHCKSGGVGLDLQHARHEIFIEIPPDPPTFKQAVGRIHRDGQARKQFVSIFLAAGTIQERIYDNLIVKDKVLSDVIGDKKSLQDFLL